MEKICFVCEQVIKTNPRRVGPSSDKYPEGLYRHSHHGPDSREWQKISNSEVARLLQSHLDRKEVKKMATHKTVKKAAVKKTVKKTAVAKAEKPAVCDEYGFRVSSKGSYIMCLLAEGKHDKKSIIALLDKKFPEGNNTATLGTFLAGIQQPIGHHSGARGAVIKVDEKGILHLKEIHKKPSPHHAVAA